MPWLQGIMHRITDFDSVAHYIAYYEAWGALAYYTSGHVHYSVARTDLHASSTARVLQQKIRFASLECLEMSRGSAAHCTHKAIYSLEHRCTGYK